MEIFLLILSYCFVSVCFVCGVGYGLRLIEKRRERIKVKERLKAIRAQRIRNYH